MALTERHIKPMMDVYSKFGLSEDQLSQLKSILRSGKVGAAQTNDLITDAARSKLSMGYSYVPSDLDPDLAGSRKNLLDFIQRNSQATTTPTPTANKPGKITAQQFFEGKKANVPRTTATPNVVTRPVQPNLPAYGPMQPSSYPQIEITPATKSTGPHNAKIRGVQLDQPQPMQGPRPATQLGPQRAPIQGPRMSTPPISTAAKTTSLGSRFAGALSGIGNNLNPIMQAAGYAPVIGYLLDAGKNLMHSDRGRAFTQSITSGNYGQALRHLTGQYQRVPGLTYVPADTSKETPKLKDVLEQAKKVLPTVQKNELENDSPITSTPPVNPRGPSHEDLLNKFDGDKNAARDEGLRIWARKHKGLAKNVKPGSTGYEVIQEVINTDSTGAAINPYAQAFADQKIGEMFTDNRLGESFTKGIELKYPRQGFELDAAAPYSNADLGDIEFLSASQMPPILTSPGQSFEIPQEIIDKAKAMSFDPNNPTKQDPDYAAARDAQISNYLSTRTTQPVFDEVTQSWKQVPIIR